MKNNIFLLALVAIVWNACNFSVGTKKDLMTGLSVSNNGFSFEEAYLVGPDNVITKSNQVNLGSQIAIVVEGIENYELKDGKAFPGLSLVVTDKDGTAVISEPDLLAGPEGYPPTDASVLRGTVTVGAPMKSAEVYHVKMKVWDKNKTDNEINAEIDIVVQ